MKIAVFEGYRSPPARRSTNVARRHKRRSYGKHRKTRRYRGSAKRSAHNKLFAKVARACAPVRRSKGKAAWGRCMSVGLKKKR